MPLSPNRMGYLPMIDRPIIEWPNNVRVAFWVAPNIEHAVDGGKIAKD